MTVLYAGIFVMALGAALGVLYGARRRGREVTDRRRANLGVFAHRRREIAAEGAVQGLSDGDVALLDDELIASLHDEAAVEPPPAQPPPTGAPGLATVALGAALAVVGSVGLYSLWGEPGAPVLARAAQVLQDPQASGDTLEALADALAARLARRPEDGSALFHLGHLKIRMRDFEGAAETLSALRALGTEAEVEAAWAQARYLADGGRLRPGTRAAIDGVLTTQPNHPMMLELLAMDALQRDAPAAASGYLGRLLEVTPAGPRRDLFGAALALAHERMGAVAPARRATGASAGARDGGTSATVPAAGVPVSVSVAPGLGVDAVAPVFVIARAPAGGGPPYAVRRLTVADLPARLLLNDGDAMMPGRRLSDLEAFELIARVGASGSPTRAPGDFESRPVTVGHGAGEVALDIAVRVR